MNGVLAAVALLPALAWGLAGGAPALLRIGMVGAAASVTLALFRVLRPRGAIAGERLDSGRPPPPPSRRGVCTIVVLALAGLATLWPRAESARMPRISNP